MKNGFYVRSWAMDLLQHVMVMQGFLDHMKKLKDKKLKPQEKTQSFDKILGKMHCSRYNMTENLIQNLHTSKLVNFVAKNPLFL